jgi:deazaflavin-dependent oxidoreductase (nitroreductase family)
MSTTQHVKGSRRPGRGQAALNLVMRAVLGVPGLHRTVSQRVLVIDVVGRSSGRRYRIPVGYVATDDGLLIGTAGRWRRNLRSGGVVRITVGRRTSEMTAEVITDEKRCALLYRAILAHNPVHGRYAGIHAEPDGSPNPRELRAALDRGVAVVRLRPVNATAKRDRLD